jgi:uncharacterized protein (DUF433 family)
MNLPAFLTQDADGEVRLTGHRIGLYTVIRLQTEGWTAGQINAELPSLPPDVVQRVLDFYQANRAEVDEYVRAYRAELERQEADHVPGPGTLKLRRLMEKIRVADEAHRGDPAWASLGVQEKLRRIELAPPTEQP